MAPDVPLTTAPIVTPPKAPLPPAAGDATGPSGTAGAGAASGYDHVGYASWYGEDAEGGTTASGERFSADAISAAHRDLPLGSFAEVTSLATGRTILVRITDRGPGRRDREIDLSAGALRQLGGVSGGLTPVRVRAVTPTPGDQAALTRGQPASPRLDTPEVVLRALRRQLPAGGAQMAAEGPRTRPRAATPPALPATGGVYVVQVAALSSAERANALATRVGGTVATGGAGAQLYRVRLGPFRDLPSAQRARDGVAARGYGDATIQVAP